VSDKAAWILVVGLFIIVLFFRLSSPYEQCVIANGYKKTAVTKCGEINASISADVTNRNGTDTF
jgi:hypothetical protein